jgi:hypothetical protein
MQSHDEAFTSYSHVYEVWNSTHVRHRELQISRRAQDVSGAIDMQHGYREQFYALVASN